MIVSELNLSVPLNGAMLEMIANGAGLSEVLNELCAAIDSHAPGATSFVCLMDSDGKHLGPSPALAYQPHLQRPSHLFPIGPDRGSCGTAAFTKRRVIIPDISRDPKWPEEIRNIALEHGVCAAWSEPLISKDGKVLGTFCVSYGEPRNPDSRDIELIEAAGNIARIAIERERSQEDLKRAADELRQTVDTIPALAWCTLPDGSNEFLNQRWHDYTGLSAQEAQGWGWQVTIHPTTCPG